MAEKGSFASQGFLEKLLGPVAGESGGGPDRWVGDALRNHLVLLLNTRAGSLPNLPDYGMPDVSAFYTEYPTSLVGLRSLMKNLIEKYEPRLSNVQVRIAETSSSEFRASFEISGELEERDSEGYRVKYLTTISGTGHADVE